MEFRYKHSPLYEHLKELAKGDERFNDHQLLVFCYNTDMPDPVRWSTRRRDLISKQAKVLNSEWCVGYMLNSQQRGKLWSMASMGALTSSWRKPLDEQDATFMICGYRWYESKWVEVVDKIDINNLAAIEWAMPGEF